MTKTIDISTLEQLDEVAQQLSLELNKGEVIFLKGDLGSGKTTFTQLLLKNLGYTGKVKSPTYAIYESYQVTNFTVIHMDLYRLSSSEELYYLAIDELFSINNVVIIEWPSKGQGVLPKATRKLTFEFFDSRKRTLKIDIT